MFTEFVGCDGDVEIAGDFVGHAKFENAAVGDIVVRDTFEKVGQLTIDEALICDKCGFLTVMESGKEVGD